MKRTRPTSEKNIFRKKVYFCLYFHFRCPYLLSKCTSGIEKFTVYVIFTLFCEKQIFIGLGMCASWKKFGQKIKNFEIFFDVIDNHTCVYIQNKEIFKLFHFSAKFLNFLKGPPVEFFRDRFFSTNMQSQAKFH